MVNDIPDSLRGIKLTKEGEVPMTEIELVKRQSRADFLLNPIRASIVQILREGVTDYITSETIDTESGDRLIREKEISRKAMSAVEIVNRSKEPDNDITPFSLSQAYHHLSKLIEHKFVIKYGTVTKGMRTTDYYRRTANVFVLDRLPSMPAKTNEARMKQSKEQVKRSADRILELFNFELDETGYEKLVDMLARRDIIRLENEVFAKVVEYTKGDITTYEQYDVFHEVMIYYLMKNDEWVQLSREVHDLFFSKI
ncbi:MAG: hypothetical protein ACW98Y_09300 [Candidatus Thorarchaeota archaeon]|jgi:DNA-binding PadR family transcriptional regulator